MPVNWLGSGDPLNKPVPEYQHIHEIDLCIYTKVIYQTAFI